MFQPFNEIKFDEYIVVKMQRALAIIVGYSQVIVAVTSAKQILWSMFGPINLLWYGDVALFLHNGIKYQPTGHRPQGTNNPKP